MKRMKRMKRKKRMKGKRKKRMKGRRKRCGRGTMRADMSKMEMEVVVVISDKEPTKKERPDWPEWLNLILWAD